MGGEGERTGEGERDRDGEGRRRGKGRFVPVVAFYFVRIYNFQIFGPVMQITKFKNVDEVIARANKNHYGLAGAVFTTDLEKALKTSHEVRGGSI